MNEKLKLIFLLGQIAKAGALGYEYSNSNTANDAFGMMTKYCCEKLVTENIPHDLYTVLNEIIHQLNAGVCIEIQSNNLQNYEPEVSNIWLMLH